MFHLEGGLNLHYSDMYISVDNVLFFRTMKSSAAITSPTGALIVQSSSLLKSVRSFFIDTIYCHNHVGEIFTKFLICISKFDTVLGDLVAQ